MALTPRLINNIAEDYSEYNDLAAKMPDKLRELQELFLVVAR
jgi:arylsulfatase